MRWLILILLLPSAFAADDWQKYDQPGQKDRNSLMTPQTKAQRDLAVCIGNAGAERFRKEHIFKVHGRFEPDTFDQDAKKCHEISSEFNKRERG